MKNLSVGKRNSGAASVATKAFAWMLSIMLVVTGLSPSFAANNKAAGKGVTNTVTKSEAKDDASDKAYKNSKKAGDKEKATLPEENKKKANNKASKTDKKPANNNDKVQKVKAKGSREGASPAHLSKKKAAALKKEVADEADAAVWRGFGAYYANLAAHNKKSQNINPKDSLKIKAAKNLKNSLDTKISKKSQKNIDYKKTSKMYNKKEKKRVPPLEKEEIVDLNSSGSVKAIWKSNPLEVDITFDKNGGEGDMPSESARRNSLYTLPKCAFTAPFGKVFDKWEVTVGTEAPVDKQPGESIVASSNVTVKAIWRNAPAPGKVNVTFDSNGGTGMMAPKQVDKDSEYTLPVCSFTAPAGKEFDKWLVTVGTAAAVEKMPGDTVLASDNVTVKAMWKNLPAPSKVDIKFNANGGSGSMPTKQVDKDSEYTLPVCGYTAPEGKEFDKWSVTVGSGTAVNKNPGESIMASDNVTVKALWKESTVPPAPGKVNVTFEANGGTGMMAPKQVDKDSEYTLPVCGYTAPAGKEFDKWLVTVGTAAAVEKIPGDTVVASDNVTVKAMWKKVPTPGKVDIRFNANGGSGSMSTKQVDKDSEYTLPVCGYTAPAGKEFDKWSVTVGSNAPVEKNLAKV